jgi:hypothetical protein
MRRRFITLVIASLLADPVGAADVPSAPRPVGRWDRFEVAVTNATRYADPYRDVALDVAYTRPDGRTVAFWGFHDGGTTWKLRFMPDRPGTWRYEARFSDGSPGASGSFTCVPSDLPGMVAVDEANPQWFGYKGGKHVLVRSLHVGDRFFAATWDAARRATFLDWAQRQGYNTLSVASHYLNRDAPGRGRGWDTPALWPLNAAEYRRMEAVLDDLARRRLIVFPFAGFFGRASNAPNDPADQELYVRYTLARLGPYWNVLLNVGGPEPHLRGKPYLSGDEIHRLGRLIRRLDVFGHPLTVHNPTGDDLFKDADWLTYGTLQGPKTADRARLSAGLLRNHHPRKPLYAQETLWSGNVNHVRAIKRDYTDDDLRKNAFVLMMSAAALNFADNAGDSSTGFSGTLDLADRKQERHDVIKGVWDYFETVPFYRMTPRQDLVDAGYCLADEGRRYLVYLESRRSVNVAVAPGAYAVEWVNARDTTDRRPGGTTHDGRGLTSPKDGDDWLVSLTMTGGGDATEPARFAPPWTSPFRVDPRHPHHLVNAEGRHLFILNKTAWAYFGCKDPAGVVRRAKAQGVNVLRVALEGRPYLDHLGIELWPWGGTRDKPDWTRFNDGYWDEVERRVRLAGNHGLGIDLVLYMALRPGADRIDEQRPYWAEALRRLGKYANVLTWEIVNESLRNEAFQDAAGQFFAEHDPFRRPVCTSDGTTDDAAWPHKPWVGLAINHSCTSSTERHGLRDWYLAVARNTRAHGKPAWCNESGRERRHRNDDPVHRRKQGWLWSAAGCFWTHHSWEGCEGIDEADYRGPGQEFLKPMADFWQGVPFWELDPNHTAFTPADPALVNATLADPDRRLTVAYVCTERSGERMSGQSARLRLPGGEYEVTFVRPADAAPLGEQRLVTKGLQEVQALSLPDFTDDLVVKVVCVKKGDGTPIPGTR